MTVGKRCGQAGERNLIPYIYYTWGEDISAGAKNRECIVGKYNAGSLGWGPGVVLTHCDERASLLTGLDTV